MPSKSPLLPAQIEGLIEILLNAPNLNNRWIHGSAVLKVYLAGQEAGDKEVAGAAEVLNLRVQAEDELKARRDGR